MLLLKNICRLTMLRWLKKFSNTKYMIGVKRGVIVFIACMAVLMVACGSNLRNDGRAVSERIIKGNFVDSASVARDIALLDTMLTPVIFGRDFAMAAVEAVEQDSVKNGADLYKRISVLKKVYEARKGERAYREFLEGVQSYINQMPVKRQMELYAKVSTPKQLGTALRIDRSKNFADSAKIKEQVNVLKTIYNEYDLAQFMKYYNMR